ncbi:MAG: peptidoglycan editing factor PgeF [Clostridia bacterium]|nr:peptidoglycan editing factor PgeF [Clostridia bacterium]
MNQLLTLTSDPFVLCERDGVAYYRAPNLVFPHGFSTRMGGVSTAPHLKSLNLAYGRGDEASVVEENQRRFFHAVFHVDGLSNAARREQIHSADIVYADKGGIYPPGDGFFTDTPGVILTVKIADCVPILLADPQRRLIAALHAGWRGTVSGIARKGVEALCDMGADPLNIQAAVGTSIRPCCYEVREDFYDAIKDECGEAFAERFVTVRDRDAKTFSADVAGMNLAILKEAGVKEENIAVSPLCTACHGDLFFSHRASKGQRGTMMAAIMLDETS